MASHAPALALVISLALLATCIAQSPASSPTAMPPSTTATPPTTSSPPPAS
ncbi:hypothetical protein B296_00044974, partial [Ensete ventricosum]